MWKRQEKGHTQQAATVRCGEKALHHVTAVDVLTLSHGLSESYSPWTQCSSCISVCLPSLGRGAEMGLKVRELHLDTHRAFLLYKQSTDNVAKFDQFQLTGWLEVLLFRCSCRRWMFWYYSPALLIWCVATLVNLYAKPTPWQDILLQYFRNTLLLSWYH